MSRLSPPPFVVDDFNIWKKWFNSLWEIYGDFNGIHDVTKTSVDYNILDEDHLIAVDTTSTDITVTLPDGVDKKQYIVKVYSGANNIILTPSGSDTIDGAASLTVSDTATVVYLDELGDWLVI